MHIPSDIGPVGSGPKIAEMHFWELRLHQSVSASLSTRTVDEAYACHLRLRRFPRLPRSGDTAWMRSIGDTLPFMPPHVRVEDGRLVEYPLAPLARFILEDRLGLVHLAATTYLHQFVYAPNRGLVAAQQALLKVFKREVEAIGARFLVANLWTDPPEREAWRAFFRAGTVSCRRLLDTRSAV
jgi:hypothetical protein